MDTGRARLLRNAAASLIVLGVLLVVAVGLPAADAALPATRAVRSGPYPVGAGVTLVPPPGAQVDVTGTRPGGTRGRALFVLGGSVRYAVVAIPFSGTLDEASVALRRRITSQRGYQITGPDRPARTATGVPGRQGGFATAGREGRYIVFVHRGLAVDLTVSGSAPELRRALPALERSIASLDFGDTP
jgi:hypothetical protein